MTGVKNSWHPETMRLLMCSPAKLQKVHSGG
jgi:hypothetical protein